MGELGRAEVGLPAHRLVLLDAPFSARAKHCEAVVLRGDVDPPGRQVLHRVVGAAVAERQLEGLEADRPAQELMPEADPEHRHLAHHAAYRLDHVVECRRIARPIRKEDRIRLARKQLFRRGSGRVQLQAHAALAQIADDRALDAGVQSDYARARVVGVEDDRLGRRHLARQVAPRHRRLGLDPLARLRVGDVGGEDAAAHGALVADVPHERACIYLCDRRDAAVAQPGEPAALGARGVLAVDRLAHDDGARMDPVGLHRLRGDAVVADQRVGENDDLAGVAGIGHGLLVAGHRGVEDHLAETIDRCADQLAVEAGPVLQEQEARTHRATPIANARSR